MENGRLNNMRLTDEQIMDIKEYLNRSIKITISSLIPQISKHGLDLIDTIEALRQENEQLQREKDAAIADIRHLALIRGGGCSVCKHWNKANPKLPWCNSKHYTCEFEWRELEVE